MKTNEFIITAINLHLFANSNTNVTGDSGLSPQKKTFYDTQLIRTAEPMLCYDRFGIKVNIPKGKGKSIEFRRFASLPKSKTPLTEGVTPDGQKLTETAITAEVKQYGGYVEISDMLDLVGIDNNLMEAISELSAQAARTLDTLTRDIVTAGTNVQYAEGQVTSRANLQGGSKKPEENHYMTVEAIRMAVRQLKIMNAPKIDGRFYGGIIHPDVAHDIMSDPDWKKPHEYKDTTNIYANELGAIAGVRFLESTEAKVFKKAGKEMSSGSGVGSQRDVYATMIFGKKAYGVTEIEGGGLKTIVKQLGSGGTSDPLDQRATAGWKATHACERLVEEYMIRIETCSTFNNAPDNA